MAWWHRNRKSENKEPSKLLTDRELEDLAYPPDLSTKPKDIVQFQFGFSCKEGHVSGPYTDEKPDPGPIKICRECGKYPLEISIIKLTCEARWERASEWLHGHNRHRWTHTEWGTFIPRWTKYEFVHHLESPKRRKK